MFKKSKSVSVIKDYYFISQVWSGIGYNFDRGCSLHVCGEVKHSCICLATNDASVDYNPDEPNWAEYLEIEGIFDEETPGVIDLMSFPDGEETNWLLTYQVVTHFTTLNLTFSGVLWKRDSYFPHKSIDFYIKYDPDFD